MHPTPSSVRPTPLPVRPTPPPVPAMRPTHLIPLVEELSMESFLNVLLPRLLPDGLPFEICVFQGKADLLHNLEQRLRGYSKWMHDDWRLVVLVDRDNDDCIELKDRLERSAVRASLRTRSSTHNDDWQLVNRIVVEELEAWYFGDRQAVCAAYPKVNSTVTQRSGYRDPDAVRGGTWEAFERILQRHGYFTTGLRKTETARAVAPHIDPDRNRSRSFKHFWEAITEHPT